MGKEGSSSLIRGESRGGSGGEEVEKGLDGPPTIVLTQHQLLAPAPWPTLSVLTSQGRGALTAHKQQIITYQLQVPVAGSWVGFFFFSFLFANLVLYNLSSPINACDWPALSWLEN